MVNPVTIDCAGLQELIDGLRERGYRVLGPTTSEGAITIGELRSVDDLPRGTGDVQEAGRYRMRPRDDEALFGFAATAQSPKSVLFPADELLWRGRRSGHTITVEPRADLDDPVALVGVRGCDLAAIRIQDQILTGREYQDSAYASRRSQTLIVAVTCGTPADTCFCTSMGTGPHPGEGADLTLTEIVDETDHRFVVETGSPAGAEVLSEVASQPATDQDRGAAADVVAEAEAAMGRWLRTDDLHDLLYDSAESPVWADVGHRCLSCTNCTMVCPTCFCTSVEDTSDLSGDLDERHRVWDSCFSMEYSRLHGGAVRTSTGSRYRQWLTHKLAAWTDQFGTSGCVGCGRCITWCPAAIDLTEEVRALRSSVADPTTTPTEDVTA